jgi:hypothetical protein
MQPGDMKRGNLYDLTFNENGVSRRVHVKYLRPVNMSQSPELNQPGHRFQLVDKYGEDYRMMFDEESNIIEDDNYYLRGMLRERFRESDNTFMIGDDQFEDEEFKILQNKLVENQEQMEEMFAAYNLKLGPAPPKMFTKGGKGNKKSRKSRKSRKSKKSRKSRKSRK